MDADAFDELVAEVLDRAGMRWDELALEQLAVRLGAARVVLDQNASCDGHIAVVNDHVVVTLSSRVQPTRRRFTLAHEIGHLVLWQSGLDLNRRRREGALRDQERFCNEFAASLLMPKWWLVDYVRDRPPGLRTVYAVSQDRNVSLSSASVRLRRILDWRGSLVRWHRLAHRLWRIVAAQNLPNALRGALERSDAPARLLEARRAQGRVVDERLVLTRGQPVDAELCVTSRNGVMYLP